MPNDIYSIYLITNLVNGKQYVGFTSNNPPEKRWRRHIRETKRTIIHRAIKKYGQENFQFQVIYQSQNRDHTLKEMERYFIESYGTFNPKGYNLTLGGEGSFGCTHSEESNRKNSESHLGEKHNFYGKHHLEETKKKISKSNTGIVFSEDRKRKISESMKGKHIGTDNPFHGKQHSEESKKKMSESHKLQRAKKKMAPERRFELPT